MPGIAEDLFHEYGVLNGKAAQESVESAQHIPQQPQPESVTPCDDCEYYDRCSERPFNKSRGCRLRYAE
jgi:hypothetical protein